MNTESGNVRANVRAAVLATSGALFALISMVMLAGPAAAYGPGGTPPTSVGNGVVSGATQVPAATTSSAGGLAFTGADVAGLIAIALLLIVVGFGIRTMGRRRQTS